MPIDPRHTIHILQRWSERPLTRITAPNDIPLSTVSGPYPARIIVADSHRTECARG
jgi:hypothetical protein